MACRKHLGNSDMEDSRTKKKCLCFEVCALCLSSTIESSRLYMWQNLVESRWYPMASSAQICQLCTIGLASSNDHLSKLKLSAHYIKNIKYRVIDIDMWCGSQPSSPVRIVCPCTDAMWPNDVCHQYLKFKSVWPCSMCIQYTCSFPNHTAHISVLFMHAWVSNIMISYSNIWIQLYIDYDLT